MLQIVYFKTSRKSNNNKKIRCCFIVCEKIRCFTSLTVTFPIKYFGGTVIRDVLKIASPE